MVVDNGCEVQGNVVLGHADLFGDLYGGISRCEHCHMIGDTYQQSGS